MGKNIQNFTEYEVLEVVKAYLIDGKSHRQIQREILNLPAPQNGGGFIAMNILHEFEIYKEHKSILSSLNFENEFKTQNLKYRQILNKLKLFIELESESENEVVMKKDQITELETITKKRIGQKKLRTKVIENYGNKCALCDIHHLDLLNCSHIVPWAMDKKNRLNPENAICLCAMHDRLFDKGYFSLDENYNIILGVKADNSIKKLLSGSKFRIPKKNKPNYEFLKIHYNKICAE